MVKKKIVLTKQVFKKKEIRFQKLRFLEKSAKNAPQFCVTLVTIFIFLAKFEELGRQKGNAEFFIDKLINAKTKNLRRCNHQKFLCSKKDSETNEDNSV